MSKNIIITGGLGNQMFEYALALSLRHKGYKVKTDTSMYGFEQMHNGYELERVFGIDEQPVCKGGLHLKWLRLLNRFSPKSLVMKDPWAYSPEVTEHPKRYMWGNWQSENYFKDIKDEIRSVFTFKGIDDKNREIGSTMSGCQSVSLHVRRGDYAQYGMLMMEADYYKQAVEIISEKVSDPVFFIFSDDAEEAAKIGEELGIHYEIICHNKGDDSYKDMYLMSHCKHNIIANSSFSWWGAWLNANPDKIVVAPKTWSVRSKNHPQLDDWILI